MASAFTPNPRLNAQRTDRAAGVLLGAAVGDALGVPYEFQATLRDDQQPRMIGSGLGPYKPGEYSDDTQMQVCVAEVAATGADLRGPEALDAVAANFQRWRSEGASDVGSQTRAVLYAAGRASGAAGAAMLGAARDYAAGHLQSAGNGSLMRTGIVALAYLGDAAATAEAAVAVSPLTHPDPDCADACVLWCSGIRTAVLEGTFDGVRAGLDLLPPSAEPSGRSGWTRRRLSPRTTSPPTAGSSPRSRPPGRRSRVPRFPSCTPASTASPPSICSSLLRPLSGPGTTPTRSPRSPALCSAPAGAAPASRCSGSRP
jgi:hypothetical protein